MGQVKVPYKFLVVLQHINTACSNHCKTYDRQYIGEILLSSPSSRCLENI